MIDKFAIGETKDGEFEFGEFYHLATAILAYPKTKYIFVGNINNPLHVGCLDFIEKFKKPIKIVPYSGYKRKFKLNIGYTADLIQKNYQQSIHEKFRMKIYENADSLADINKYIQNLNLDKEKKYAFLWIRNGKYKSERNITNSGVLQIYTELKNQNIHPILIGNDLDTGIKDLPNLQTFYLDPIFSNKPFNQLILFNELIEKFTIKFSIGLKSGGMDGPTLAFGLPCVYFGSQFGNRRINKLKKAILKYHFIPFEKQNRRKFKFFSEQELAAAIKIIKDII